MNTTGTYHHTFSAAGTHTFELHEKPKTIFIKNMTNGIIKASWGNTINNNDYTEMLKETAEPLNYFGASSEDLNVTVQASGTGNIEVKVLDY